MKKIVLLVEDKPEEITKAREILKAKGYSVAVATTLADADRIWTNLGEKLSAVITDIHFPEGRLERLNQIGIHPNGLVLVTRALLEKKPLAVCCEVNHHDAPYLVELFANLQKLCGPIPVHTNKYWQGAIEMMEALLKGDES